MAVPIAIIAIGIARSRISTAGARRPEHPHAADPTTTSSSPADRRPCLRVAACGRSGRLLGLAVRQLARRLYPEGSPRALARALREVFDTVEVNSTFYRLASRDAVARWVEETPPGFVFAAKASRYMTHIKRLQNLAEGIGRYYEGIEPLVESGKLGPVVWQFPANFKRDDDRLGGALAAAAARAPLLRVPPRELVHGAGLQAAARARRRARDRRPPALAVPGARAHHRLDARPPPPRPPRPARQLLGDASSTSGPGGSPSGAAGPRCFVYFNNDWEGFAVDNALSLKRRLQRSPARLSARRSSRETCICE